MLSFLDALEVTIAIRNGSCNLRSDKKIAKGNIDIFRVEVQSHSREWLQPGGETRGTSPTVALVSS